MDRTFSSVSALAAAALALVACGCGRSDGFRPPVSPEATHAAPGREVGTAELDFARTAGAPKASADQVGLATWYGAKFAGRKTANGERFDPTKLTAAHRKLAFGTWVEVRRPETGRTVRVRINDRGPWGDDRRVIDLSQKAAEQLDLVKDGVAKVELRVVTGP